MRTVRGLYRSIIKPSVLRVVTNKLHDDNDDDSYKNAANIPDRPLESSTACSFVFVNNNATLAFMCVSRAVRIAYFVLE